MRASRVCIPHDQSPSPSCSRTTARCRTIRRCRCWSTKARSTRTPIRTRHRNAVFRQWLGPRPVAQRHLSVRALSLDDPRGARHRARPRQSSARRTSRRGVRACALATSSCCRRAPAISGCPAASDLLVIGAYPPEGTYNLCRGDNPAERDKALTTIPAGAVAGRAIRCWARTDRCRNSGGGNFVTVGLSRDPDQERHCLTKRDGQHTAGHDQKNASSRTVVITGLVPAIPPRDALPLASALCRASTLKTRRIRGWPGQALAMTVESSASRPSDARTTFHRRAIGYKRSPK